MSIRKKTTVRNFLKRATLLSMTFLLLATTLSTPVGAVSQKTLDSIRRGYPFYNPCQTGGGAQPEQTDTGGGAASGSVKELAQQMLDNPKITYWTNNGVNTRDIVSTMAQTGKGTVTASNTSTKETDVNPAILQFVLEVAKEYPIMVNAITDKTHSSTSNHYKGKAIDLDNNGSNSPPTSVLDPIAAKYGGKRNNETTHWHYDFTESPAGGAPASEPTSAPTPATPTTPSPASAPAGGGEEVGASLYGGSFENGAWVAHNGQQGGGGDDTGIGDHDNPLPGTVSFAELDNGTALGGLKQDQKVRITYNGKSVVALRADNGGGGGDVQGKKRAIDLWWETARMLDFKDGLGIVKWEIVPDNTPVTPFSEDSSGSAAISGTSQQPACCSPGDATSSPTSPAVGAAVGGAAGAVSTFPIKLPLISDPAKLAAAIDAHTLSKYPSSPFVGKGKYFVEGGMRAGINPLLGVAQATKESAMGTTGAATNGSLNAFGRTTNPSTGQPLQSGSGKYDWYKWESWEKSLVADAFPASGKSEQPDDWFQYVARRYADSIDDINKFVPAYAPGFENDVPAYIRDVLDVAIKIASDSGGAIDLGKLGVATGNAGGLSGSDASNCPSSPSGSTFGGGDLSATVLAYAWPEQGHQPPTEKMPAYAAAITKAKAEGQYVGNDGVDCGGFVTRLMIDSGFEPNYNYAGKLSDGAANVASGQLPWLQANWQPVNVASTADLRPGDVGVNSGATHTYVYVGQVPGFSKPIASASNGERAPMASGANTMDPDYSWYRKK